MTQMTINGAAYEVRVPFEIRTGPAHDHPVYRKQEPALRKCDCCDRCPHVERVIEELHSIEELLEHGWLVNT